MVNYKNYITIEPGKRSGKPCIRSLRITVYDILNMLADGMSTDEIIDDFPKLSKDDILACLAYAADKEHKAMVLSAWNCGGWKTVKNYTLWLLCLWQSH